jgi:hypothetical protein
MPPVTTRPVSPNPRNSGVARTSDAAAAAPPRADATTAPAAGATGLMSNAARLAAQTAARGQAAWRAGVAQASARELEVLGILGGGVRNTVILGVLGAAVVKREKVGYTTTMWLAQAGLSPQTAQLVGGTVRDATEGVFLTACYGVMLAPVVSFAHRQITAWRNQPTAQQKATLAATRELAEERFGLQEELEEASITPERRSEILETLGADHERLTHSNEYAQVIGELMQASNGRHNRFRSLDAPPFLNGETPSSDPAELLDQTIKFVRSWNQN